MTALKPGLYKATMRGVPDQIVMARDDAWACTLEVVAGNFLHDARDITNARPLIILDLDGAEREYIGDLRYVADRLPEHNVHRALVHEVADQIEAQTKPARIPEPGLWGVVEAGLRTYRTEPMVTYKWVRHDRFWVSKSFPTAADWTDLIDPTLIRDGIS